MRWFWLSTLGLRRSTFLSARLPLAQRFIKFCLVGGSGVFVDMGVLFFLADPKTLGLNITFSKICAAEIALINNFIWNELWTFRNPSPAGEGSSACAEPGEGRAVDNRIGERDEVEASSGVRHSTVGLRHGLARRFFLFNAICGIGIGLAVLLLHFFYSWLRWNLYVSNLLAIVLVTFWNFGMNARFNWRLMRGNT